MSWATIGGRVPSVFRYPRALCGATFAIFINVGVPGSGLANGLYDDPRTAEGWAWSKIQQGEMVDLNEHCGTPRIDPNDETDTRWQENCRKLSAHFLQDVLTRSPRREATSLGGISITGATFEGNIDLSDVQLIRTLVITYSRVEGQIDLSNARTNSRISLDHVVMSDELIAENLHSDSELDLLNGVFKKAVSLAGAKIDGVVNLSGTKFEALLNADNLRSQRELDLENGIYKQDVSLIGAKIDGMVNLSRSRFEAPLNAATLEVGGSLLMGGACFKAAAKIAGPVSIGGSSFEESFDASFARIGYLSMASDPQHTSKFKQVKLIGAKITEQALFNYAVFDGDFDAGLLQVDGTLSMIGTTLNGKLNATSMIVNGDFSINGARFEKEVNLNYANIRGSLSANGSDVDGPFNANSLRVGGNLFMASFTEDANEISEKFGVAPPQPKLSKAKFKKIVLIGSAVEGNVFMPGAVFEDELTAPALRVGGSIYMRDAQCLGEVDLNMVHVGGNLDLRGATLAAGFDLSGASIGGDLQLGGEHKSAVWQGNNAVLYLRSARIANLVDAADAWPGPGRLHLDGFPFGHLGGINGATGQEMRKRGAKWERLGKTRPPVQSHDIRSTGGGICQWRRPRRCRRHPLSEPRAGT